MLFIGIDLLTTCDRFIFLGFTFLGVKSFGEAEFWLASAKVAFISIFFLCAILISSGVIGGEKIGFKFYHDPGAFHNGVKGVFEIFVFAALQYSGTEMIGLTAGESRNPSTAIPKAVKSVLWRIVGIFLGGIFFLTITVPYNDPNLLSASSKTARSPFVIAFTRVGVHAGAHAVNAVIVITILSAVNGALYVGARTLYGLAAEKQAPAIFGRTNKHGVPVYAYIFMNLIGFLSLLNLSAGAGPVYRWIVSMTGVSTFITCKSFFPFLPNLLTSICKGGFICLCQIRMRAAMKKQNVDPDILPFRAPGWPYVPWIGLVGNAFFVFFQGWTSFAPWDVQSFVQNYIVVLLFLILGFGWKVYHKTTIVQLGRADLETGIRMVMTGGGEGPE